jgi:hypothetical protein
LFKQKGMRFVYFFPYMSILEIEGKSNRPLW